MKEAHFPLKKISNMYKNYCTKNDDTFNRLYNFVI